MKYVKEFENTSAKNQYLDEAPTGYYVLRDNSLSENRVDILYHYNYQGLTFTAKQANSTVKYKKSTVSTAEYSTDGTNWNDADNVTITLANIGDKVYFRGVISGAQTSLKYAKFIMTGEIAASGSIMSMYNNNPDDVILNYKYCYYCMFYNCTSLVTAPELPATTLANDCYSSMFSGCTSLVNAPELPATTLTSYCYAGMFEGCTSLVTAPELPATTLSTTWCYHQMFYGCTSLVTAPELPATTLTSGCYNQMFYDCTSLNYIKCLATDISVSGCTGNWVYNVARTGTFVTPSTTNWTTGVDGIRSGWTRVDA